MASPPNGESIDIMAAFRKIAEDMVAFVAKADTGGGPDGRPDRVVSREERITQLQGLLQDPKFLATMTRSVEGGVGQVGASIARHNIQEVTRALEAGDTSRLNGLVGLLNDLPATLSMFTFPNYMPGTAGPDMNSGGLTPAQIRDKLKAAGVDRVEPITAEDLRVHFILPLARAAGQVLDGAVPPR